MGTVTVTVFVVVPVTVIECNGIHMLFVDVVVAAVVTTGEYQKTVELVVAGPTK
jgi:hypothetical protein